MPLSDGPLASQASSQEIEEEFAAALPSPRVPTITRRALHVVPFVLLAAAVYVLWREFHELTFREVAAAIRAWGLDSVAPALGLSAASFLLMSVTEHLGLRWSGARLPWRTVIGGSFLANSIAHSLGANLLVAGAIRARLYGRQGVSLQQVAACTLFGGMAFAVGLSSLAGLGLLLSSREALSSVAIHPQVARSIGAVLLCGAAGYLLLCCTKRRAISVFGHHQHLPSPAQAVGQLAVGLIDNAMAAAIIWCLLPPGSVSYLGFVGAYAIAVAAGLASSVPAGAGVFEGSLSTLIHINRAPLAAALLGYRLAYFILPLILGVLALSADTAFRRRR